MHLSVKKSLVCFSTGLRALLSEKKVVQKLQVEKIGMQNKNSEDYLKSIVTCALYYPENVGCNVQI